MWLFIAKAKGRERETKKERDADDALPPGERKLGNKGHKSFLRKQRSRSGHSVVSAILSLCIHSSSSRMLDAEGNGMA